MTHELAEPERWLPSRWWTLILLVFATQLGLIFWLGKPQHIPPLPNDFAPTLRLTGPGAAQVLALTDPTLFALPHRESFSGEAWLTIPAQEFRPFVWSEPPRWLTLVQTNLGIDFKEFMSTNQLEILPVVAQLDLELKMPRVVESSPFPRKSTMRVTGALAERHLLVPPALPSWRSAEILTNSVVQILVGADGKPVSPTLLKPPGIAPTEADLYALREARKTRFEPLDVNDLMNPLEGLTWGQLIFEWQTLPLPATNNAAGAAK
jgi:hypothetical protein